MCQHEDAIVYTTVNNRLLQPQQEAGSGSEDAIARLTVLQGGKAAKKPQSELQNQSHNPF